MTDKEIAERLRDMSNRIGSLTQASLTELADELDPPRPEPGTVVWWRDAEGLGEWSLGQINNNRKVEFFGAWKELDLEAVQIKPARIAKPMQEIVDIPPVSEWPKGALRIDSEPYYRFLGTETRSTGQHLTITTRTQAERREAEG